MGEAIRFDSQLLRELYGEDLAMAADVFDSSLRYLVREMDAAEQCFRAKDLQGLRKVMHQLKPLFGYLCLPDLQQQAEKLERSCEQGTAVEEIFRQYGQLNSRVSELPAVLSSEINNMRIPLRKPGV